MNKFKTLALVLFSSTALLVTSCTKDDEAPEPVAAKLTVNTVTDLDASKGAVYYSLSTNKQVTVDDITAGKWDLKFATTKILVNGGTSGTGTTQAQIVLNKFEDLVTAPATGYKTDGAEGNALADWYKYTGMEIAPFHAIFPLPGKIFVIKTSDGKYAKLEMISYYKGNPDTTTPVFADLATRPASPYYTFRFAYQADGTTNLQ